MKFTLSIDTDNAAFEDNGTGEELASILLFLVRDLKKNGTAPGFSQKVFDTNGNKVGFARLEG